MSLAVTCADRTSSRVVREFFTASETNDSFTVTRPSGFCAPLERSTVFDRRPAMLVSARISSTITTTIAATAPMPIHDRPPPAIAVAAMAWSSQDRASLPAAVQMSDRVGQLMMAMPTAPRARNSSPMISSRMRFNARFVLFTARLPSRWDARCAHGCAPCRSAGTSAAPLRPPPARRPCPAALRCRGARSRRRCGVRHRR